MIRTEIKPLTRILLNVVLKQKGENEKKEKYCFVYSNESHLKKKNTLSSEEKNI